MIKKNILFIFFLCNFFGHQSQLSATKSPSTMLEFLWNNTVPLQTKKNIIYGIIGVSATIGLISTIKTYITYKSIGNTTQNIKNLLEEIDVYFPFISDWRLNKKNKKIITQIIDQYDPALLINDYKKATNFYINLISYKTFLNQENFKTKKIKEKLYTKYTEFEDTIIALTTFLNNNKCRLKYTQYLVDQMISEPYFSLKNTTTITKAIVLFPEHALCMPFSKAPWSTFYFHDKIMRYYNHLHAHKNVLLTLKVNDKQTALMNKIDLALKQLLPDFEALNTEYKYALPNNVYQTSITTNASNDAPGINKASTVFEVKEHVITVPKPVETSSTTTTSSVTETSSNTEPSEAEPTTQWGKYKKALSNLLSTNLLNKFKQKLAPKSATQEQQKTMPDQPTPE
jgi:hypothetical protein